MTTTPAKVKNMMAARTTAQLVADFEATETNNDQEIPTVRGWIMDELETRDSAAFDAWLDGDGSMESLKKLFVL